MESYLIIHLIFADKVFRFEHIELIAAALIV